MLKITDILSKYETTKISQKMLIKGEPGTGKTELFAKRVVHLIEEEGLEPRAILILSFTRNSVREMKDRIKKILKKTSPQVFNKLKIMTFDRFAAKILQDDREYRVFDNKFETNISNAVSFLLDYTNRSEDFQYFFSRIRYVIVDEIQDLYYGRAAMLQCIFSTLARIQDQWGYLLLLDECQEIFSYMEKKGEKSELGNFFKRSKNFVEWAIKWTEKNYPDDFINEMLDIPMSENIRFKDLKNGKLCSIMKTARFILTNHPDNIKKLKSLKNRFPLITIQGEEEFFHLLRDNEDKNKTTCLLFRGNETATNFSLKLYQQNPPFNHIYQLSNQSKVFPNWIAFSVKNSIRDDLNLSDSAYIEKEKYIEIWNLMNLQPKFNLDADNAWNFLSFMATESEDEEYIDLEKLKYGLLRNYSDSLLTEYGYNAAPIIISNIHKSKGREYDYVFLEDASLPNGKMFDLDSVQLFARLNYVALTRCRKDFKLLSSTHRSFYNYRTNDEYENLGQFIFKIKEKDNEKILEKISFLLSNEENSNNKQEKIWNLKLGEPVKVVVKVDPPEKFARVYILNQNPNKKNEELCVITESYTKRIIKKINGLLDNTDISKEKIKRRNDNTYTLVGARIVSLNTELLPPNVKEFNQVDIPLKDFLIGYWLGFRIMGPLYIKN